MKNLVIQNQKNFYNDFEWTFSPFSNFIKRNNISRVTLDYMASREKLYNRKSDVELDIYYPWALVFTWRICDTASIENPKRGYHALDEICPRTCSRYDVFFNFKTDPSYSLIQRWNAGYRSELNLEILNQSLVWKKDSTRLIFSPFIPV